MTKQLFYIVLFCTCWGLQSLQAKPKTNLKSIIRVTNDKITDDELDSLRRNNPFFLEEIVIQGFKQDKDYRLSPVSTSSINSKLIQKETLLSIKEITGLVPNLYMPDYGAKVSSPIYIRGIGSKINSPSVGLYIDGVPYFESSSFDFNFSNIESLDVLRGPQGTLYGRNTMGGIINVYTKSPIHNPGTTFKYTGGNHNLYDITVTHSIKIKEDMGISFSGNYNYFGGFFTNEYLHEKADKSDGGQGRIRFDWNITPKWKFKLITSLDYFDQNGFPYGLYNTETDQTENVNYNRPTTYIRTISTSGVNVEYSGKGYKINSQTSFQYLTDNQRIDQDFTPKDLYAVHKKEIHRMFSEELNIKSDSKNNYQWLFGLFGFHQHIHRDLNVEMPTQGVISNKLYEIPTYGLALFHQSTLNNIIWDGLSLSAGIRFDYEHANNDYQMNNMKGETNVGKDGFDEKLNFRQVTPKFTLQYTTSNLQNIYASVTRGYKAGGFNTSFDKKEERTFDPEYSWNYELGTKLNFCNNRFFADIALFYIDWKNQQVFQPIESGRGRKLKNAGKSASKGIEISLSARPVDELILQANYGYTKAYFKKYLFSEDIDFKDHRLPLVPDHTLSLHADYTFYKPFKKLDEIQLGVTYLGTGKIYWADNNELSQSYYDVLNAQISFKRSDYMLSFWAKNITNKKYNAYVSATASPTAQKSKPFTIGGTLTIRL
ncbi:TonB-dependent receptor [Bacteroides coprosuis DSM 18011]|uniref:TonB-dependent receptor n=1 Tax=Bacteroides coprosuis DSM 18011 TaxID=679937 RepID=F3ZUP6_9BACE|nr:TonB-dependent receptor [Bacteroides coprosuis]EGJ71211.1 TonB-dependent receptor [Bacteroides coprosuis DSM 18011]